MDRGEHPRPAPTTIGGMLRIDPTHPPLWRTPTTLQFGRTGRVRLDEPALWQLQVIHELAKGVPEVGVAALARSLGVTRADLDALLIALGPVLVRTGRALRVGVEIADDPAARYAPQIRDGLHDLGIDTSLVASTNATVDAVVMLAAHGLHPRRAAAWMRDDTPHVGIVLGHGEVEVGPLVVPGQSACLECVAAHERDRDASWPLVAAQLIGRREPAGPAALASEAALHAGRLLLAGRGGLSLRATLATGVEQRTWDRHPECSCESLPETATAHVPVSLPPTTATATAVPA